MNILRKVEVNQTIPDKLDNRVKLQARAKDRRNAVALPVDKSMHVQQWQSCRQLHKVLHTSKNDAETVLTKIYENSKSYISFGQN